MLHELTTVPYVDNGYVESGYDTTSTNSCSVSFLNLGLVYYFYSTMSSNAGLNATISKTAVLSSTLDAGSNNLIANLVKYHLNDIDSIKYGASMFYEYINFHYDVDYVELNASAEYQELYLHVEVLDENKSASTTATQQPVYLYTEAEPMYLEL